jgi:hypothetical protein
MAPATSATLRLFLDQAFFLHPISAKLVRIPSPRLPVILRLSRVFIVVCSPASTCVECGQRYAKGCGWCRSPTTGAARCMLTTTRSCSTLLTLSASGCHDFFSCTVRASPSIVGSNINANLNVVLKYMGLGSAQYTWNVTATYRSATGAIVDTRRVLSSETRFLPALAPSSSPVDIAWSQSLTIPTNPNGIPDIYVQISPAIIVLSSGRLGYLPFDTIFVAFGPLITIFVHI